MEYFTWEGGSVEENDGVHSWGSLSLQTDLIVDQQRNLGQVLRALEPYILMYEMVMDGT